MNAWYKRLWDRLPWWLHPVLFIVGLVLFLGTFGVIASLLVGSSPGFGS